MTFTVFVGMVGGAGTTSAAFTYARRQPEQHSTSRTSTSPVTSPRSPGCPPHPTDGLTDALAATYGQIRPRV